MVQLMAIELCVSIATVIDERHLIDRFEICSSDLEVKDAKADDNAREGDLGEDHAAIGNHEWLVRAIWGHFLLGIRD